MRVVVIKNNLKEGLDAIQRARKFKFANLKIRPSRGDGSKYKTNSH